MDPLGAALPSFRGVIRVANGFNLGTAWVQIAPSLKGVRTAVQQELNGVDVRSTASRWGGQLTSAVGGAFQTVGKVGVGALGAVGSVIAGMAVKGGIDRALNIENAQAKLKGLGHDSADVSAIMESALKSVKGTAYGLGDAATVAASMSAAGVKSGQEMQTVLTTVADTAQISGRSMSDIGAIFSSVAARGKLQGDDMLQLMSSGVPVLQFLSDQLGVTTADVSDMVSKGRIDFQTFQAAMQAGLGGAAQAAGDTFSGSLANVKAALSRLGESAATPVLEALRQVFVALAPAIDQGAAVLAPFITLLGDKLAAKTPTVVDGISSLVDRFSGLAEGAQSLVSGGGLSGASELLGGLSPIIGAASGAAGPLLSKIPLVGGAFSSLTGPVGLAIGAFTSMMRNSDSLRDSIGTAVPTIVETFQGMGPGIGDVLTTVGTTLGLLGDAAAPVVDLLTGALVPVLQEVPDVAGGIAGVFEGIAGVLADHTGIIYGVIGAYAAFKAIQLGTTMVSWVGGIAANTAAWVANKWALVASKTESLILYGMYAKDAVVNVAKATAGVAANTASWAVNKAGIVAHLAVLGAQKVAMGVSTAAQWAFNAAMNANPISIVVIAVGALVAALVAFFTKTELGQQIWQAFTTWLSTTWTWLKDTGTAIWQGLGTGISNVWTGIKTAASAAAQWVYDNTVGRFNQLKATALVVFALLGSGISTAWSNIKTTASNAANWVKDKALAAFHALRDSGITAFQNLKDGIDRAWSGLKKVAAVPVNFVIKSVYTDGLKALVENVAGKVGLHISLPTIRQIAFAQGGVMPGYSPGRDIHQFWSPTAGALALSGGEAIMRPEFTRAVGGPSGVAALNAAARRGQRFADGGVFGAVGSWFADRARGIGSFISDIVGSVTELITAPVRRIMAGVGAGVFGDIGKGGIETVLKQIPEFFKTNLPSAAGLVGAAMKAVAAGIPYVWGGSTSAGLDCSGLVYWAAQQLGLGWPRLTAAGYQSASVALQGKNAAPGDLLFWGTPAHHVAVYAGSGMMVEEPRPGLNARYTSIWGNPTYGRYAGKNSRIAAAEYDQGGWLQPGMTQVINNTGRPEPVLNPEQWAALRNDSSGPAVVNIYDVDGKLIATMRGEIMRELGSASRTSVQARLGVSS
jgi:tape measure domain-containing protein